MKNTKAQTSPGGLILDRRRSNRRNKKYTKVTNSLSISETDQIHHFLAPLEVIKAWGPNLLFNSRNSDLLFEVSSGSAKASNIVAQELRVATEKAAEKFRIILYEPDINTYPPNLEKSKGNK